MIPTPKECPQCGIELILNGEGWGFCDNCVAEIEYIPPDGDLDKGDSHEGRNKGGRG